MRLTARNALCGKVEKITHDTVVSEVELRLQCGLKIVSVIERQAVDDLGLVLDCRAHAVFQAEDVSIEIETRGER